MVGYLVSVFAIHATDMHDCTVRRIQRPAYRSPRAIRPHHGSRLPPSWLVQSRGAGCACLSSPCIALLLMVRAHCPTMCSDRKSDQNQRLESLLTRLSTSLLTKSVDNLLPWIFPVQRRPVFCSHLKSLTNQTLELFFLRFSTCLCPSCADNLCTAGTFAAVRAPAFGFDAAMQMLSGSG